MKKKTRIIFSYLFFHLQHPVETGDISEKETQTNAATTLQGSLSSNLNQLRPSGVHTFISLILPLHKCLPGVAMRNVLAVRQGWGSHSNCFAYWCIILGKEQSTSLWKKIMRPASAGNDSFPPLWSLWHKYLLVQVLYLTRQGHWSPACPLPACWQPEVYLNRACIPKTRHRAWHMMAMFRGTPGPNARPKLPHLLGNTVSDPPNSATRPLIVSPLL